MADTELYRDGDIAILKLNRPGQLNAITTTMIDEIEQALDQVAADNSAGLILTGEGRGFCAGSDLKKPPSDFRERVRRMHRLVQTMLNHPKLIVAAMNGLAYGGGLELAMGCALRVAHPDARICLPETKLGIIPGYGGTQMLPRLIGTSAALDMLLLGDPVSAARAQELGLVHRLADDPVAMAAELIQQATQNGQKAQHAIRKAVWEGLERPLEQGLDLEFQLISDIAPDMASVSGGFTSRNRKGA